MKRNIFRSEVFEAQAERWLGDIHVATPVSTRIWTASLVAVVVVALLIFVLGSYTRREAVSGSVSSSAGVVRVRAAAKGEVQKLLVFEGQYVKKGQPIAVVDSDKRLLSYDGLEDSVGKDLFAQQGAVEESVRAIRKKTETKRLAQQQELAIARRRFAQSQIQLKLYEQEAEERAEVVSRVAPLAEMGYVSGTQVRELRSQLSTAKLALENHRATVASISQEIVQLESQIEDDQYSHEIDLSGKMAQLSQLAVDQKRSSAQGGYVLSASASGTIASLQVKQGEFVEDGQVVSTIVPQSAMMEVELQVPSESIGFVRIGTPVLIKYAAFPYQKFGTYLGKVSFVPLAPQFRAESVGEAQPAIYLVKVKIDRQNIYTDNGPIRLMPGMAVSANMMLEKRRLYEWILTPIYSLPVADGGH